MSSTIDAGYYADQAYKESQTACPSANSPDGKHESVIAAGHWPSVEYKCKHCGEHLGYSK